MQKNPIGVVATFDRSSGFATRELIDGTSALQPFVGVFKIRLQRLSLVYTETVTKKRAGVLCCSLFTTFETESNTGRAVSRFMPLQIVSVCGEKGDVQIEDLSTIPDFFSSDKKEIAFWVQTLDDRRKILTVEPSVLFFVGKH